jgi:hypothetical protein
VSEKPSALDAVKIQARVVIAIVRALELIPADGLLEAFLLAQYNIQATGHVARLRRDIGV